MVVDLQAVNPRSAHSTASKLRLWKRVSSKAGFKSPPLTVKELKHVTGALIKADYRTSMAYAGAAKAEHLEQGHPWTDSLQFAWRKALRASKKGIGPPSRATPFPILQLQDVTSEPEAVHEQGPIYPRRTVILCGWWMLRHIEAMHLRTTDVTLLDGSTTVHLRSSKGDLQHLGIARTLDCRCAQVGRSLCPNCLMTEHLQHFEGKDLPLFPDKLARSTPSSASSLLSIRQASSTWPDMRDCPSIDIWRELRLLDLRMRCAFLAHPSTPLQQQLASLW